ncbi:ARM repeat-containing protein [Trichodelitschia bisporula]|uniref:ARM repeat-containing protein n=1 Tax=Trichodelitschia bisporula TaxID=703511 RepID=A0A6G1I7A5_9PEZI|nr:ARM repeat-containing protein [Trichodelitschia bisporula]
MAAVELPGEANPLTQYDLLQNLLLASSRTANTQQLQTATKQLEAWQQESRFYVYLQGIFIDDTVPFEIRYLAVLQLLDAVTKRNVWSRGSYSSIRFHQPSGGGIQVNDKALIRSRLLNAGFNETDDRLARQNALILARILRTDFPKEWPTVFDDLFARITSIDSPGQLQTLRGLELLRCIVKEFGKTRLRQAVLRPVTPAIIGKATGVFTDAFSCLQTQPSQSSAFAAATQAIYLCSSILRHSLGRVQNLHQVETVVKTWTLLGTYFTRCLSQLDASPALAKGVVQIAKLQLGIAEEYSASFALLPGAVELVAQYWDLIKQVSSSYASSESEELSIAENIALRGIQIFRALLRLVARDKDAPTDAGKAAGVVQSIFVPPFCHELFFTSLQNFFVLRRVDFRRWEEDPEEWEASEASTKDHRLSLRASAEKLLTDLTYYSEDVLPSFFRMLKGTIGATPTSRKEAVYTALGVLGPRIKVYCEKNHIDFSFDNNMLPALLNDVQWIDSETRILRRRIPILIAAWAPIEPLSQIPVTMAFSKCVDRGDEVNDLVVRITAVREYKSLTNVWDYNSRTALPYVAAILQAAMGLVTEVELPETKLDMLGTVRGIVNRLDAEIDPFADQIVNLLPDLWAQSTEAYGKVAILSLLTLLFGALKANSARFQTFALQLVQQALGSDMSQADRAALLEDALELWTAVIDNAPRVAAAELNLNLITLLKDCLIPALGAESKARHYALKIAEGYLLLIPGELIVEEAFVTELLRSQATGLLELSSDASFEVRQVVSLVLQVAAVSGSEPLVRTVLGAFVDSGFMRTLIAGLHESWTAHQTTGPKAKVSKIQGGIETNLFILLARFIDASPSLFLQIVGSDDIGWLFDEWFEHAAEGSMDNSSSRLCARALTRLFELAPPFLLARLQLLMGLWADTMQLEDTVEVLDPAWATPGMLRAEELRKADTCDLRALVQTTVATVVARCGGPDAFRHEWLANVDDHVIKQFEALMVS